MRWKTPLRGSTSIPYEIMVLLDALEPNDQRPPELVKWEKEVAKSGVEFGIPIGIISKLINEYAIEKGYTKGQIRRVKS